MYCVYLYIDTHTYIVCVYVQLKSKVYRDLAESLMLPKEKKTCIKSRGVKTFEQNADVKMLFFSLNIIFFHLIMPFRSYRK